MILQKLKSKVEHRSRGIALAKEVEALRRHDWSDPLFDEWCSSAAKRLAPDANKAEAPKGSHCRLVSKICI